ncbi:hypothetical protein WDJ51_07470 [Rathayibacter sp. YIM 133350]|uniref:hypothetical protein n=1 Tax=Rathayibacter sp. YIM 133350 TaxID=3131992 RepID=UPI00307E391F
MSTAPASPTPTSNPLLRRALIWSALLALVIMVVGGVVGFLVAGWSGVASALAGTAMAVIFMGITAGSILLANRFAGSDMFVGAFFGIVMGGWLLKLVLFVVLVLVLRGAPWIQPMVLFLSVVAGVIGSLAVDVIVVTTSRMPYASDAVLPGSRAGGSRTDTEE